MTKTLHIEEIASCPDYRRLHSIAGVSVELRYASANNFASRDLYGDFDCAWLHRDAAAALELGEDDAAELLDAVAHVAALTLEL